MSAREEWSGTIPRHSAAEIDCAATINANINNQALAKSFILVGRDSTELYIIQPMLDNTVTGALSSFLELDNAADSVLSFSRLIITLMEHYLANSSLSP